MEIIVGLAIMIAGLAMAAVSRRRQSCRSRSRPLDGVSSTQHPKFLNLFVSFCSLRSPSVRRPRCPLTAHRGWFSTQLPTPDLCFCFYGNSKCSIMCFYWSQLRAHGEETNFGRYKTMRQASGDLDCWRSLRSPSACLMVLYLASSVGLFSMIPQLGPV